LTSDIGVVGIQSEIKFSSRETSYPYQYKYRLGISFASTIISNGLPNIDNDLLWVTWADAMIPLNKKTYKLIPFIVLFDKG
jgi:hypothetical protein